MFIQVGNRAINMDSITDARRQLDEDGRYVVVELYFTSGRRLLINHLHAGRLWDALFGEDEEF